MTCRSGRILRLALILALAGAGELGAQTTFNTKKLGGGTVLPDGKTFVVTVPSQAKLIFYDTLAEKEIKSVEVDFQPSVIAAQKDKLFVGTKGAPIIHV